VLGSSTLRGKAELKNLDNPRFTFDLRGDHVNLDELLDLVGSDDEKKSKEQAGNPHGLAGETRSTLRGVNGNGKLRAASVKYQDLPMRGFEGDVEIKRGVVRIKKMRFDLYGGTVEASGTELDLPREYTGYTVKAKVKDLDLGRALSAHTKLGRLFEGRVTQEIDVNGAGLAFADLASSLTGPVQIKTQSLTIESLDLLGPIGKPVAAAVAKAPGIEWKRLADAGGTTLKDLQAWLNFKGGKMELKEPIDAKTAFGALRVEGHAFLDKRLDFTATAKLSPATIASATGGKVRPKNAIPVPLKIGGTWDRPAITGIDAQQLIAAVLGEAVGGVVSDAKAKAEKELSKKTDAAKAQLDNKRKETEGRVRRRADDAKKAATDEAKKQADAAKKKAAEAKKKAEAEAKKRADAAKKKAQEEAKRKAEAAKKKAAEEAKKLLGF
jgi:hypothetical protein